MPHQPTQPQEPHRPHDPFRILAITTIILGLLIVIAAFVFWALTSQQSSLMVGAGLALAGVGSIQRIATYYESQITPPPPPPPAPPSVPPPVVAPSGEEPTE